MEKNQSLSNHEILIEEVEEKNITIPKNLPHKKHNAKNVDNNPHLKLTQIIKENILNTIYKDDGKNDFNDTLTGCTGFNLNMMPRLRFEDENDLEDEVELEDIVVHQKGKTALIKEGEIKSHHHQHDLDTSTNSEESGNKEIHRINSNGEEQILITDNISNDVTEITISANSSPHHQNNLSFQSETEDINNNKINQNNNHHNEIIISNIPVRLDKMSWSLWHTFLVSILGVSWILDGLEITIISVIGGVLQSKSTLSLSSSQIGASASIYILGCVIGSLCFGYCADRFGRKKLFILTPAIYLLATLLTAASWTFWFLMVCQFVKGLGIGGEYSAMNSAINEFIPARLRGFIDLGVNGSYWLGATLGSILALFFLDTRILPINVGWRLPFILGTVIGILIIISRFFIPESPRWLISHGKIEKAEEIVSRIEKNIEKRTGKTTISPEGIAIKVRSKSKPINIFEIIKLILVKYWKHSILSLSLMVSQTFFYNAIFFTYSLILVHFYNVEAHSVGLFLIPFAICNFLGVIVLGKLFDTVGRKPMIFITYSLSAVLLIITGILFLCNVLNAITQTICWSIIFFIASAGASASYLTIAEIFPIEIRAISISIFYSIGTAVGGLIGPVLFGFLIQRESRLELFIGYLIGSFLLLFAAIVELILGVKAEKKSLEEISSNK